MYHVLKPYLSDGCQFWDYLKCKYCDFSLLTRCNTPTFHNTLMGLNWHYISARSELGKGDHEEKKLSKGSIPFNRQNIQLVHWWVLVQHCGRNTLLFNHLLP